MEDLDELDLALLALLQEDASQSVQEIAAAIGLSPSPCWRRIKRLERAGVIQRRVAILDPSALGIGVTVFVSLKTSEHSAEWLERFSKGAARIPEIVEIYRMSGEVDYLLKVLVANIDDYDRVYKKLIEVAEIADVSSSFAMERIKFTSAIPLPSPSG